MAVEKVVKASEKALPVSAMTRAGEKQSVSARLLRRSRDLLRSGICGCHGTVA